MKNLNKSGRLSKGLILDKFCSCLELWKGCILAGIFTMSTSVFDLLWSIVYMIDEDTIIFFYLLFVLGIESIIFIAATGLLFIALIKRSKCLLLPWLLMAFVDVFFSLLVAFAELTIPNNFNTNGCTVPAVSMVVTLLVCFITIYCWLCVYGQYLHYAKNSVNVAEIKVTPIDDRPPPTTTSSRAVRVRSPVERPEPAGALVSPNTQALQYLDHIGTQRSTDTLKVPQVSTPRDAW